MYDRATEDSGDGQGKSHCVLVIEAVEEYRVLNAYIQPDWLVDELRDFIDVVC